MRRPALATVLAGLVLATGPAAAPAFDTGPHGDITVDAMRAEGFRTDAADIARVNNWFVDFYSNASDVPYSDKGPLWKTIIGGALGNREHWPKRLVDAAAASHMDSSTRALVDGQWVSLRDPVAMESEWRRLRFTTYRLVQRAKRDRSPLELLTAIGISTHPMEDFYSHTNWPETPTEIDGPDWKGLRQGTVPTFFDVPKAVRDKVRSYAGGAQNAPRKHGDWADKPSKTVAKDWPGRPSYAQAYMAGYFATRQWIRAIHTWLKDETLWRQAQRYAKNLGSLDHDDYGATMISTYTGHLYGEGGPCKPGCDSTSGWGGSLVALRSAVQRYFEGHGKTVFRKTFEKLMPDLAIKQPLGVRDADVPMESSRPIQAVTRFVRLRILRYRGIDLGDIGPDDADIYARGAIGGQRFVSPVLQAHDSFSFPPPYYAFTFMKAVRRGALHPEPVETMTVRVRTSSARYSGTDDDVYLRIGSQRFPLDKRLYDDFERGDDDTYSVPIDKATRRGLDRGDITRIQIEKSRDGIAGGWKLRGVTVKVNGRTLYARDGIERWLEDGHRTWRATDFTPQLNLGTKVGVWFDLREDDLRIYGTDDQGDINRYDRRDAQNVPYPVGGVIETQVTGAHLLGGRLGYGGDKAFVRYRIDTLDPELPPVVVPPTKPPTKPPVKPPPPPPTKADLLITLFNLDQFTVKNQGGTAAGPFWVRMGGYSWRIDGLAPGASETRSILAPCEAHAPITADADGEVDESDETNNTRAENFIC